MLSQIIHYDYRAVGKFILHKGRNSPYCYSRCPYKKDWQMSFKSSGSPPGQWLINLAIIRLEIICIFKYIFCSMSPLLRKCRYFKDHLSCIPSFYFLSYMASNRYRCM